MTVFLGPGCNGAQAFKGNVVERMDTHGQKLGEYMVGIGSEEGTVDQFRCYDNAWFTISCASVWIMRKCFSSVKLSA